MSICLRRYFEYHVFVGLLLVSSERCKKPYQSNKSNNTTSKQIKHSCTCELTTRLQATLIQDLGKVIIELAIDHDVSRKGRDILHDIASVVYCIATRSVQSHAAMGREMGRDAIPVRESTLSLAGDSQYRSRRLCGTPCIPSSRPWSPCSRASSTAMNCETSHSDPPDQPSQLAELNSIPSFWPQRHTPATCETDYSAWCIHGDRKAQGCWGLHSRSCH